MVCLNSASPTRTPTYTTLVRGFSGVNIIEWSERLGERKESLFPQRAEIHLSVIDYKEPGDSNNTLEFSDEEFEIVGRHHADIKIFGTSWSSRMDELIRTLDQSSLPYVVKETSG